MEVVRGECEKQLLAITGEEKRGQRRNEALGPVSHCLCVMTAAEAGVETENRRLVAIIDVLR